MANCTSSYMLSSWAGNTATTNDTVWYGWNTFDSTTSSSIDTYTTWTNWNLTFTTSDVWVTWVSYPTFPQAVESEEELQARQQREEELRREREAENALREQAEAAAEELLEDLIGEKEMEVFRSTGRMLVKGKEFDYLLHRGGAVQRVEKDKIVDLCIHLPYKAKYVDLDNVIALKCFIQGCEKDFNKQAHSRGSRPRPVELPLAANG